MTRGLVVLGAVFLLAFVAQRGRSGFLAAEAGADLACALADQHGFRVSEVLALHELFGGRLAEDALRARVEELAACREEMGHVLLAVLLVRGKRPLAERLRREAGADPDAIQRAVRAERAAIEDAVRFAAIAERYAARGHDT